MKNTLIDRFVREQGASSTLEACRIAADNIFPNRHATINARTSLNELVRSARISVRRDSSMPFEGKLERGDRDEPVITLGSSGSSSRQMFTLAHELGHYIIQETVRDCRDGTAYRWVSHNQSDMREEEKLANLLAAELLLPCESLRESLITSNSLLGSLRDVCSDVGVSMKMAIRRFADVTSKNYIMLEVVPYLFGRRDSLAEIDDAVFVTANSGTYYNRSNTKLLEKIEYQDIASRTHSFLEIVSPWGLLGQMFELEERLTPIPHVIAFAARDVDSSDRARVAE